MMPSKSGMHFNYSAVQSQNAVTAHFTNKQILRFGLLEQYCLDHSLQLLNNNKVFI